MENNQRKQSSESNKETKISRDFLFQFCILFGNEEKTCHAEFCS